MYQVFLLSWSLRFTLTFGQTDKHIVLITSCHSSEHLFENQNLYLFNSSQLFVVGFNIKLHLFLIYTPKVYLLKNLMANSKGKKWKIQYFHFYILVCFLLFFSFFKILTKLNGKQKSINIFWHRKPCFLFFQISKIQGKNATLILTDRSMLVLLMGKLLLLGVKKDLVA